MEVVAGGGMRGRTRSRDIAAEDEATTTAKRRKLEEEVDGESRINSSPCVEFTNRGGIMPRDSGEPPETNVVFVGRTSSDEDHCRSTSSGEEGGASISCCSSNGSCDKVDGRNEFLDLERSGNAEAGTSMHYCCNTRSGISLCFDQREESVGMDSAVAEVKACDVADSRRRNMADNSDMTVTEAELDEFFTAAEKDLRSKIFECSTKFNFDFVKEEPLDGRYEWIRLKP